MLSIILSISYFFLTSRAIKAGALSLFTFLLNYTWEISSLSYKQFFTNSFKIPYLKGKLIKKKYLSPWCIKAISLKISNLYKSVFPPETIHTTFFPLILSLCFSKADTDKAPEGSTIIPQSYNYKIAEAISPSLAISTFSGLIYYLQISKHLSPT